MKPHVKYKIQPQKDGSFVILMKDTHNNKLTIHSSHDTYEDANDELTDIKHKPSQAETMKFMDSLRDSLKNI